MGQGYLCPPLVSFAKLEIKDDVKEGIVHCKNDGERQISGTGAAGAAKLISSYLISVGIECSLNAEVCE